MTIKVKLMNRLFEIRNDINSLLCRGDTSLMFGDTTAYVLLFDDHKWFTCYYEVNVDKFIETYKLEYPNVRQVMVISPDGRRRKIEL